MTQLSTPTSQDSIKTFAPKIVYALYLISILFPLTFFIAPIVAYFTKNTENEVLHSHYRFQIRTFWIGMVFSLILIVLWSISPVVSMMTGSFLILIVLLGLGLLSWVLWLVIRSAKGFKYLNQKQPIPNPLSWMFGE